MKYLIVLSLVIVATVLIEPVVPSCEFFPLKENSKGKFCVGPRGPMRVGEKVRHPCEDCVCMDPQGLVCCGIGYNAGVAEMEGCQMIRDPFSCCYSFVKTETGAVCEENKQCPDPL